MFNTTIWGWRPNSLLCEEANHKKAFMERRSHFDMATSNLRPRNPTISLNVAMELSSHRNDLTILAYNTDCLYIRSKKRIKKKYPGKDAIKYSTTTENAVSHPGTICKETRETMNEGIGVMPEEWTYEIGKETRRCGEIVLGMPGSGKTYRFCKRMIESTKKRTYVYHSRTKLV